jgi:hypothetical protein
LILELVTIARIETMKKLIMEVTAGRGSPLFLFRAIPVLGFKPPLPAPELFASAWMREGQPDFDISQP